MIRVAAAVLIAFAGGVSIMSGASAAPSLEGAQSAITSIDANAGRLLITTTDSDTTDRLRFIRSSLRTLKGQLPTAGVSAEYALTLQDDAAVMSDAIQSGPSRKQQIVLHVSNDIESKVGFIQAQPGAASSWKDSIDVTVNVQKSGSLLHGLRVACNTWRHRAEVSANPQFIFPTAASGAKRQLPIGEVTCAAFDANKTLIAMDDFQVGADGTPDGVIDILVGQR
jgi:hypothetical protein